MNTVNTYPTDEYETLEDFISFEGFLFTRETYRQQELDILQPQLQVLGYTDINWLDGEYDSFGPLTRVCRAKTTYGETRWFIYG